MCFHGKSYLALYKLLLLLLTSEIDPISMSFALVGRGLVSFRYCTPFFIRALNRLYDIYKLICIFKHCKSFFILQEVAIQSI